MVQPDAEKPSDLPDCFAGTDSDPVPDGGILTVKFTDPARAKQSIAATAHDGDDPTATVEFEIPLRGNGRGSALLIVPVGWGSVVLSAPGSRTRSVAVALPP